MINISIYDDNLAEAMWHFINSDNLIFEDFCSHNEFNDMSIFEYIVECCLDDFKVYALEQFGFNVV